MAAKDSPLKQFEIDPISNIELGGYNISFTNSSFAMLITVLVITLFLTLTVNTRSIIPSRMQLISELMYNFIAQLLSDTVGDNGEAFKVIHISGLGFDNDSDMVALSHISSQISNAIFIPSISIVNFLLPFEKYLFSSNTP